MVTGDSVPGIGVLWLQGVVVVGPGQQLVRWSREGRLSRDAPPSGPHGPTP